MTEGSTDEPDITPLININLMLLVMVLIMASHAARLLPLDLPFAEKTTAVNADQAVSLHIANDGSFRLGADAGLSRDALVHKIRQLEDGATVLVNMDAKAQYAQFVWVLDRLTDKRTVRIAFGATHPVAAVSADAATKSGSK